MVQSKAPDELGRPRPRQTEANKIPSTSRKHPSSPQQPNSMAKPRAETRNKTIKRPTGGKRSPNYMKPTACSDARKERVQVTPQSPATTNRKSKTPTTASATANSKPSSCSPVDNSNTKPSKTFARKASLRPKRPSMKKSTGAVALFHKRTVRRATCSSTLKDSRFPKVLDLDPENTSVIKVCPFDYCSLNGSRHEHMHPLRRLPSARRRSLKTQRSLRLKRLSSVRKRSFRKGRRNIASGKITSGREKMTPVIEEVTDDFFIEIYAEENEKRRSNGQELDRELSKILDSLESMEDDVDCSEEEAEEFGGTLTLVEIPEIYTRISLGDSLDQSSEISFDDMCSDGDIPDAEAMDETLVCFHEKEGQWGFQCCGENASDGFSFAPICTSMESQDGQLDRGLNFPPDASSLEYNVVSSEHGEGEFLIKAQDTYNLEASDMCNPAIQSPLADVMDQPDSQGETRLDDAANDEFDDDNIICALEKEKSGQVNLEESKLARGVECPDNIKLCIGAEDEEFRGTIAEENNSICSKSKKSEQDLEESELTTDGGSPVNIDFENEKSEPGDHEESELIDGGENPDNNLRINKKDGIGKSEYENAIEMEFSESYCEIYDVHQNETTSDCIHSQAKIGTRSFDDAMDDSSVQTEISDSISTDLTTEDIDSDDNQFSEEEKPENDGMSNEDTCAANIISIENGITISQAPLEVCNKQKARRRTVNRRKIHDIEMLKLINPRAPCFLPVKPDPETEKVDLRHQQMDERKSTEAWMIDYALQRVVKKLAPARKRKVALLIEAFEAVMPTCETPLMSPTSGFGRPIQACS